MSTAVVLCGQRSELYSITIRDLDSERSSKGISVVLYGRARLFACRWYLVVDSKLLYVKLGAATVVACMGGMWGHLIFSVSSMVSVVLYCMDLLFVWFGDFSKLLQVEHENAASVGGLLPSYTNLIS